MNSRNYNRITKQYVCWRVSCRNNKIIGKYLQTNQWTTNRYDKGTKTLENKTSFSVLLYFQTRL